MSARRDTPGADVAPRASIAALDAFCRASLSAAGADDATSAAATRAMMHASRLGVDSHGVRLLEHYVAVLAGGRVNARPNPRLASSFAAVATLDGDHAHGALAGFTAMDEAVRLSADGGIGAVAIRNSSHFGAAGAYALAAAEAGSIGFAVCNADSIVRLHDGTIRFHGTNPIAFAAPVRSGNPWLLDMATSAIPFNRVLLNRSLGRPMPEGVASTPDGADTTDAHLTEMLAPLGGAFGYKGAGLAGLVEILSAVVTGMRLSCELAPMNDPDITTPRGLGSFVLAMRPDAFVDAADYFDGMERYLDALRSAPARAGARVMAPGDREWAEAARRLREGVELDPATVTAFEGLAGRYGLDMPAFVSAGA